MKFVGAHVSTEGGVDKAPLNAAHIGAKSFALFVKPQRQWLAPPLKPGVAEAFSANLKTAGIDPSKVLPHASYLINMANPDEEKRLSAVDSLIGELRRCDELGLSLLNIHPGSLLKTGTKKEAAARVADSVNRATATVQRVTVVLENTAGQGSYTGSSFDELAWMIEGVKDKSRVGVCLDTAHLYGAGFDISTDDGFDKMINEFAKIVGFDKLRGLHLNDTKVQCGSHTDRHALIGEGVLGWKTFARIMHDERFDNIPQVLETPDPDKWAEEIRRLYEL